LKTQKENRDKDTLVPLPTLAANTNRGRWFLKAKEYEGVTQKTQRFSPATKHGGFGIDGQSANSVSVRYVSEREQEEARRTLHLSSEKNVIPNIFIRMTVTYKNQE
jgi:hypothetical protein